MSSARHALAHALHRFREDISGLALLEFALTLPLMITVGGWGAELSYLAVNNMRISQYALNLADTVSRLGVTTAGGVVQIREADVNDALQGVRVEGKAIGIGKYGRVTLSSLENTKQAYDSDYTQRIHWQRCFGLMSGVGYDSTYGTTPIAAGTTSTQADAGTPQAAGMGDTGSKVGAPKDNAVMFVEINYKYQPLFGSLFTGTKIIHYTASLLVRDNRDYKQIYNPTPTAVPSTCDKHTA